MNHSIKEINEKIKNGDYKNVELGDYKLDDIEDVATFCHDKYFKEKVGWESDLDLVEEVHNFGGKVEVIDSEDWNDIEGSIIIDNVKDFTIFLPKNLGKLRRNFVIAHELGHYILHYLIKDDRQPVYGNSYTKIEGETPEVELEANTFAYSFLIPANMLKNKIKDGTLKTILDVSAYFNVSSKIAFNRIKQVPLD